MFDSTNDNPGTATTDLVTIADSQPATADSLEIRISGDLDAPDHDAKVPVFAEATLVPDSSGTGALLACRGVVHVRFQGIAPADIPTEAPALVLQQDAA